jgi:hypothetical protein
MLNQDRLDTFLNLMINNNPTKYEKKLDHIEKLLININNRYEPFMYLYNQLAESQQQELLTSRPFREVFFNILKNLPNEEFNNYFFKNDLCNLIDVVSIRTEALNRLENTKLQEFIRKVDTPTSLGKVVTVLKDVYQKDVKRFNEVLITHKDTLNKLNTIDNPKSRTLEDLYYWLSTVYKEEGLSKVLNITDSLNFNVINCCEKNKLHLFGLTIRFNFLETNELIQDCELLFSKNKELSKINIFNMVFKESIIKFLIDISKKDNLTVLSYFWDIVDPYLKDLKETSRNCRLAIETHERKIGYELSDSFEILRVLLKAKTCKEELKYNSYYVSTTDANVAVDTLVDNLEKKILVGKLYNDLSTNKKTITKMKI